jgi:hypothetical protein
MSELNLLVVIHPILIRKHEDIQSLKEFLIKKIVIWILPHDLELLFSEIVHQDVIRVKISSEVVESRSILISPFLMGFLVMLEGFGETSSTVNIAVLIKDFLNFSDEPHSVKFVAFRVPMILQDNFPFVLLGSEFQSFEFLSVDFFQLIGQFTLLELLHLNLLRLEDKFSVDFFTSSFSEIY